jgi:hypothetical protein
MLKYDIRKQELNAWFWIVQSNKCFINVKLFFARLINIFMKQIRCDSWKKIAIRCINVKVSSAKTTPASTTNNVS